MASRYVIVVLDGDGEKEGGSLAWDRVSGEWSYESGDPEISEVLEQVRREGEARIRESLVRDDAIFEISTSVKPTESRFLDALKDMLLMTDFLEFRENGGSRNADTRT